MEQRDCYNLRDDYDVGEGDSFLICRETSLTSCIIYNIHRVILTFMLQLLISPFYGSPANAESITLIYFYVSLSFVDKTCTMLYNHTACVNSFEFGSNYAFSEFQQQSADASKIALS